MPGSLVVQSWTKFKVRLSVMDAIAFTALSVICLSMRTHLTSYLARIADGVCTFRPLHASRCMGFPQTREEAQDLMKELECCCASAISSLTYTWVGFGEPKLEFESRIVYYDNEVRTAGSDNTPGSVLPDTWILAVSGVCAVVAVTCLALKMSAFLAKRDQDKEEKFEGMFNSEKKKLWNAEFALRYPDSRNEKVHPESQAEIPSSNTELVIVDPAPGAVDHWSQELTTITADDESRLQNPSSPLLEDSPRKHAWSNSPINIMDNRL